MDELGTVTISKLTLAPQANRKSVQRLHEGPEPTYYNDDKSRAPLDCVLDVHGYGLSFSGFLYRETSLTRHPVLFRQRWHLVWWGFDWRRPTFTLCTFVVCPTKTIVVYVSSDGVVDEIEADDVDDYADRGDRDLGWARRDKQQRLN